MLVGGKLWGKKTPRLIVGTFYCLSQTNREIKKKHRNPLFLAIYRSNISFLFRFESEAVTLQKFFKVILTTLHPY